MADSLWRGVIDEDPYLPNNRSAIILQLKIYIEHTFALLLHSASLPPQAHVKASNPGIYRPTPMRFASALPGAAA
jgi:hypothetical protein